MEEVAVKGLLAGLGKPTLDTLGYWIELLRGEHTATEELKSDWILLEKAIWDTYNCRSSSLLLRGTRDRAQDIHAKTEVVLDKAEQLSRYDQPRSPLSCFLKYGHNIWHTPALWKTANKMVKLRSQINGSLGIITSLLNRHEGTGGIARLQNRHVAPALQGADFVGMEKQFTSLYGFLMTGNSAIQVAVVVGMHGAGKSTLVRHVYERSDVRGHFNCHAWVSVDAFPETKDLLKCMIAGLFGEVNRNSPYGIDHLDDDSLGSIIKSFLKEEQRRYVIVLDHISTRKQLKYILDLAFPDESCTNFGRIIVTTTNLDVFEACNNALRVDVTQLPDEMVWKLFCKKVSSPELEDDHNLQQRIIGLCAGLPLAVDLLGGLLSRTDLHQWSSIIDEFQENGYKEILEKSINDLSDMSDTSIKNCFMYFSIFPKGSTVTHNTLVRLWIAEGFIHVSGGRTTQEEVATGYLKTLIERHIVQVAEHYEYGRPKSYKINGLMHDEIRKKAEEEYFCATLVASLSSLPERIRRLSVQTTVKNFPKNEDLLNVISLFISSRNSHTPKLLSRAKY